MRRFVSFLLLLLVSFIANGQTNHVVLLVDVSGSVRKYDPYEVKNLMKSVLTGNPNPNPNYYYEPASGSNFKLFNGQPLVGVGSKIIIIPFGDITTSNNSHIETIKSSATEVEQMLDLYYPREFSDNLTYITLAKAKAAEVAKNSGLNSYIMFTITDGMNDYFGHLKSPGYSALEQQLVDNYLSKTNPVEEKKFDGYIRYNNDPKNLFKISVGAVDVTKYKPVNPSTPATPLTTTSEEDCEIVLTSYAGGKVTNEKEVREEKVNLNWICNCAGKVRYNVIITPLAKGSKKSKIVKNNITSNSYSTTLKNGRYKIVISGVIDNSKIAIPAITYIHVKTGSMAWLFWVLLILILVGIVYFLWKRKQDEKKLENPDAPSSPRTPYKPNTKNSPPSSGNTNTNTNLDF